MSIIITGVKFVTECLFYCMLERPIWIDREQMSKSVIAMPLSIGQCAYIHVYKAVGVGRERVKFQLHILTRL